jgi:hypothetical protein
MHHPQTTQDRAPRAPGDGAPLDTVRDRDGRCRTCGELATEIRISDPAVSALVLACGVCGWHAVRRGDARSGATDVTRVRWTS